MKKNKYISLAIIATSMPIVSVISFISCKESMEQKVDKLNYYYYGNNNFSKKYFHVQTDRSDSINDVFNFKDKLMVLKEKEDLKKIGQNIEADSISKEQEDKVNRIKQRFESGVIEKIRDNYKSDFWQKYNIIVKFDNEEYWDKEYPYIDSFEVAESRITINNFSYIEILSDIYKRNLIVDSLWRNTKSIKFIILEKEIFTNKTEVNVNEINNWEKFNALTKNKKKIRIEQGR